MMMNKIWALLLVMVLLISIVPVAFAQNDTNQTDGNQTVPVDINVTINDTINITMNISINDNTDINVSINETHINVNGNEIVDD